MDATLSSGWNASRMARGSTSTTVLGVYAGTLFLSALLLFSVQPMFAKMVLPALGGSPSVWAVSTCFFQAMLLAGYLYAHVLNRYVSPRLAPWVHLSVLAIAMLALPVALPTGAGDPPEGGAYLWLIRMLAAGVGLPYFAVSANAPLLQAWFSRTGNPHAADPYFLYGASNLGSLLALLSYPVLIEPNIGLGHQAGIWSFGFFVLVITIAVTGVIMVSLSGATADIPAARQVPVAAVKPSFVQKARWVFYASVPSGLLVAFTTHLSTDIAAAPFLWVVPLALFLLTFVLVFRERALLSAGVMLKLQPAVVAVTLFCINSPVFDWWVSSLVTFFGFFVPAMAVHRALYEARPDAAHLTEFYLWMSFGGVLGGVFAAIAAPQMFNSTYEFPILLLLGMLCRPGVFDGVQAKERRDLAIAAATGLTIVAAGLVLKTTLGDNSAWYFSNFAMTGLWAALLLSGGSAKVQAAIVAILVAMVSLLPSSLNRGEPSRSFFGVLRVMNDKDTSIRQLLHGTTTHGAQRLTDAAGQKILPPIPATYYHPKSPMALAVNVARQVSGKPQSKFRAGIVGLGIGSMACHARSGETWRFYEIDKAVADIALDPKRFNYLSSCQPHADIVLGDARLTVAKEAPESFDYLQIDAFSSDSVPTHLMTVEAVRLYLGKLDPNGVLVMHVSNRHLDLAPVAAAAALANPGTSVAIIHDPTHSTTLDAKPSVVVVVTKSAANLAPVLAIPGAVPQTAAAVTPWTDDYSDVLSALWRVYGPGK